MERRSPCRWNDSKDRPRCIIHRARRKRERQKRKNIEKREGAAERARRKAEKRAAFRGKRLKSIGVGQRGYKTIEKRLIPEEDHRTG